MPSVEFIFNFLCFDLFFLAKLIKLKTVCNHNYRKAHKKNSYTSLIVKPDELIN